MLMIIPLGDAYFCIGVSHTNDHSSDDFDDLRSLESKMKYLNRDMVRAPVDGDPRNGKHSILLSESW